MLEITPPYWTPNMDDISKLNRKIEIYLQQSKDTVANKVAGNLSDYKMQYIGYTDNGKKWILINAFCGSVWKANDSWQSNVVIVFDGGPCFFQVRYDVVGSQFERFEVNGET
jgi:hypothetical protein